MLASLLSSWFAEWRIYAWRIIGEARNRQSLPFIPPAGKLRTYFRNAIISDLSGAVSRAYWVNISLMPPRVLTYSRPSTVLILNIQISNTEFCGDALAPPKYPSRDSEVSQNAFHHSSSNNGGRCVAPSKYLAPSMCMIQKSMSLTKWAWFGASGRGFDLGGRGPAGSFDWRPGSDQRMLHLLENMDRISSDQSLWGKQFTVK